MSQYSCKPAPLRSRSSAALRVVVMSACCWASGAPRSSADETLIKAAIDEYAVALETTQRAERLERFGRSESLFRQAIESLSETGSRASEDLLVAHGNAALQAERVGTAIVAFRRALRLQPANAQALQNLQYARSTLPTTLRQSESHGIVNSLFFWNAIWPKSRVQVMSSVFFLLAGLLLGAGIALGRSLLRNLSVAPAVCWIVLAASQLVGDDREFYDAAVVTETMLRAADSENAAPRLSTPLPDGTEIKVLQFRDRWLEVQVPGGRSGWVRRSAVECVEESSEHSSSPDR